MGSSDTCYFATGGDDPDCISGFSTPWTHPEQFYFGGFLRGTFTGVWGGIQHGILAEPWPEVRSAGVIGASANGIGVYGGSFGFGVYGASGDPTNLPPFPAGVYGAAETQTPGVIGYSRENDGTQGLSFTGTGIRAASFFGPGLHSLSGALTGVTGVSEPPGPTVPNTSNIAGVVGTSDQRHGVIGTSNKAVGVIGFSNNIGVLGFATAPGGLAGQFIGNLQVTGTKSAVVPFPDGTHRVLYCMESPEVWFEDFGAARLKGGRAVVKVDTDFAKVIKRGDYRVFLTPEGNCRGLYVRRKGGASFEVREVMGGKSFVAFSYRIVGRRKDIRAYRRFAKIDTSVSLPTTATRPKRIPKPTAAAHRAFIARLQKEARERVPKGARKRGRLPVVDKILDVRTVSEQVQRAATSR